MGRLQHWVKKLPQVRDGDRLPLLGKEYPLQLTRQVTRPIFQDGAFCVPEQLAGRMRENISIIYWEYARKYFPERTARLAEQKALTVARVGVSRAMGRWGSCNSQGRIHFSYRLLLCPEFVVEHVIWHELAHLTELNHSRAFKELLASYSPRGEEAEQWLKQPPTIWFAYLE